MTDNDKLTSSIAGQLDRMIVEFIDRLDDQERPIGPVVDATAMLLVAWTLRMINAIDVEPNEQQLKEAAYATIDHVIAKASNGSEGDSLATRTVEHSSTETRLPCIRYPRS